MKKIILSLALSTLTLISFASKPHVNKVKVNTTNSTVKWTGSKVASAHEGTINVQSGVLDFDHGLLVGGNFVIDMNSIKNTDIESEEYSAKLEGHLKNEDFFNVAEFPTAVLTITSAKKRDGNDYYILADLTIKGKTHPITFSAVVTSKELSFSAIANIKIDRTKWDVTYNSGNFFEDLGDYLIKDEIEFDVFLLSVK
jgi:polyisoprenoid-binding protein YceI